MLPGISTACFYPMTTEESLEQIIGLRPACVEVFLNALEELRPDYLEKLRARAEAAGCRIVSVHPYYSGMEPLLFFSQYERRFAEGVELYKRFFQAAASLGADVVVFHGDHKQSRLPRDAYFERFSRLWQEAARAGVSLCQENVERYTSRSAGFFADMAAALPQVEYILDVKQAVRSGEDPLALAHAMAGRVRHVHMSDHDGGRDCLIPGGGSFNIGEFLSKIANAGFDGGVIVELYRENFADIVELSRGFEHLSHQILTVS